jgi:hypothetical protein
LGVILMLAFAVSFWGLQYKLSLYHSVGAKPVVPEAKLLSQKERPVTNGHLERVLLSSRPLALATHSFAPVYVAAMPSDAQLAFQWSGEAHVPPEGPQAFPWRYGSRIHSRGPPPVVD